jgi:uncharacterized protein YkwD
VSLSASSRFRYTLVAGATAVVIGTGFTVVGLNKHADASVTTSNAADAVGSGGYKGGAAAPPSPAGGTNAFPFSDPSATAPASVATPSATATKPSASPKAKPTTRAPRPKKTTTAPKVTTPPTTPITSGTVLDQVLAHINAARSAAGLDPYALDSDLSKASALHNALMINGCGLSHQCSGEGGIGDRFTAQDVKWTSAGENIGYGSAGGSDAEIVKAANGLTDSMLAEVAPNDGHKKNLLNTGFQHIGLSVVRDAKGLVWMTQDFVN